MTQGLEFPTLLQYHAKGHRSGPGARRGRQADVRNAGFACRATTHPMQLRRARTSTPGRFAPLHLRTAASRAVSVSRSVQLQRAPTALHSAGPSCRRRRVHHLVRGSGGLYSRIRKAEPCGSLDDLRQTGSDPTERPSTRASCFSSSLAGGYPDQGFGNLVRNALRRFWHRPSISASPRVHLPAARAR